MIGRVFQGTLVADLQRTVSLLSEGNLILTRKLNVVENERQEMYPIIFEKGKQAAEYDVFGYFLIILRYCRFVALDNA